VCAYRLRCVTEEIEDWRFLSFRGGAGEEGGNGEEEDGDVKMEGEGGRGLRSAVGGVWLKIIKATLLLGPNDATLA